MTRALFIADIDQSAGTKVNLVEESVPYYHWKLREGSWSTGDAPMDYSYENPTQFGKTAKFDGFQQVVETMDLVDARGSTDAGVRQNVVRLMHAFEQARKWNDDTLRDESWWLYWNTEDEDIRRSLIFDGRVRMLNDVGINPMLENERALARMVLTRHPFWEEGNYTTLDLNRLSAVGGSASWVGVRGNVPARIWQATLNVPLAAGSGGPMDKIWVGIREEYEGFTNFNPTWECEDGTNGTDASDSVDATASDGNRVTVSYVTTDLAERMSISVQQVAAANSHSDYDHFHGRYLVLCRCKVTAGTSGIEMRVGYSATENKTRYPMEFVSDTDWHYRELGYIRIPPAGARGGIGAYSAEIELWAEEISSGGDLHLDCLTLIPADHMIYIEDADVEYNTRNCYYYTYENDTNAAIGYTATSADMEADISPTNWYCPVESGICVVAGDRAAGQDLDDELDVTLHIFPRYKLYRYEDST